MNQIESFFMTWGVLLISAGLNAGGAFLIKAELNRRGPVPLFPPGMLLRYSVKFACSIKAWLGLVSFFLSPFIFSVALSRMEMSVAQPAFVGINFICLVVLATLILKEKLTRMRLAGLAVCLVGLIFLNQG